LKRNAGEAYTNTKEKANPGKQCKWVECKCHNNCSTTISFQERKKNFDFFYSNKNWETQTGIIQASVKVKTVTRRRQPEAEGAKKKSQTREFFLRSSNGVDVKVCKTVYLNSLGLDSARVHRALKKGREGTVEDRRGKHRPSNAKSAATINKVKEHIESFPAYKSHYRLGDTPNRKYLSSDLNLSKMYDMYLAKNLEEKVSISKYRRIFETYNLKFKSPKKDTCKICDSLKIQIEAADSDLQKKILDGKKELHLRQVKLALDAKSDDSQPNNNLKYVISFDLQKTYPLPRITTNEAYYKRQLSLYNLGIHDMINRQAYMYLWHEGIASRGTQEIGSCLYRHIQDVTAKNLIAWSDSCGGQNRSINTVLFWMHILSTHPTLEVIEHKYCVSGHSYLANDRDFAQIENKIKKMETMYTFEQFENVVSSSKLNKKKFLAIKMEKNDFKSAENLLKLITNRKTNKEKQKVEWLKMRWIRLEKNKPGVIMYKYTHNQELPFHSVDIRKRLNGPPPDLGLVSLNIMYPEGRQISQLKYNDIINLLKYVPPVHHDFYTSLKRKAENSSEYPPAMMMVMTMKRKKTHCSLKCLLMLSIF